MTILDKAAFFAGLKPKAQTVEIEGLGSVRVVELSVAEAESIRDVLKTEEGKGNFGLRVVIRSVRDEDGAALFTDADIDQLRSLQNGKLEKLTDSILKINGFLKDEAAPN